MGAENFPLIEQNLYTDHRSMIITPDLPFVCKVAHTHAGYGKMKFENATQFADFRGLIAIHNDYVTAEPYIKWDYDMRIQKIGTHYKGFKRISTNWKGNVGNQSIVSDMEITSQHKKMIDECAMVFGGLDICSLDLLHCEENKKEYILELNDTAIGLVHAHEEEDMGNIRDLVLYRMSKHFIPEKDEKTEISEINNNAPLQDQLEQLLFQYQKETEKNEELLRDLNVAQENSKKKIPLITFKRL